LLLTYLCKESESVSIKLSHLDEWRNKELLRQILSAIGNDKLNKVVYSSCKQFDRSAQIIERTIPKCRTKMEQNKHDEYLQVCFDEGFVITGVPVNISILDGNTYIHKMDFFLLKVKE